MFLISDALAQTADATAQQPGLIANLLPLVLIFGVFYFLIIRPQTKKFQEHGKMVDSLQKGDEVVTGGGILGKIAKVEDGVLHVEIASGVTVQVTKASVTEKRGEKASKTKEPKGKETKNKKDK